MFLHMVQDGLGYGLITITNVWLVQQGCMLPDMQLMVVRSQGYHGLSRQKPLPFLPNTPYTAAVSPPEGLQASCGKESQELFGAHLLREPFKQCTGHLFFTGHGPKQWVPQLNSDPFDMPKVLCLEGLDIPGLIPTSHLY